MNELFPPLSAPVRDILHRLPAALNDVLPQTTAHRRQLPLAVEELSARLTSERGLSELPYWSAPRLTAAYMRYFLPWNIIRLTRLFQGLELPPPTPLPVHENGPALPRILADAGSGPLALPLALWLARPQWRQTPLTVLCMDAAPHPLELGRRLFYKLAGEDSPWRIVTRRAPVDNLAREIRREDGRLWCVAGANMLNELKARPGQHPFQRLDELLEQLAHLLRAPDATALFVEPGTRLGGKTIMALREMAGDHELVPAAPCPHAGECPLQGGRTWCHFTFDAAGAPAWLESLSHEAGLEKSALSLAFVLLRSLEGPQAEDSAKARIVSSAFRVPGVPGMARYACTGRGLALLGQASDLPSGALVRVRWPKAPSRDSKSGAWILEHAETVAPEAVETKPPAQPFSRLHSGDEVPSRTTARPKPHKGDVTPRTKRKPTKITAEGQTRSDGKPRATGTPPKGTRGRKSTSR